jgi:hypothetical protein
MNNDELLTNVSLGALAGFTATVPMSAFMLATFKALPADEQYALQPRLIAERLAEQAHIEMPESEAASNAASTALHFAYGTGVGAAYPLFAESTTLNPVVAGAAYGMAVYAAGYLGWLPATGVMAFGLKHPKHRLSMIIGAHLVWGVALGMLYSTMRGEKK